MLLFSRRPAVVQRYLIAGADRPELGVRWDSKAALLSDAVIVDSHNLAPSEWSRVQAFSRLPRRPSNVLIDSPTISRRQLALASIDCIVTEEELPGLAEVAAGVTASARLRCCGERLALAAATPSLHRAILILFTQDGGVCSVKALAAAAGASQRTLRAQWRACFGPGIRLSDLVRHVRRVARVQDSAARAAAVADLETICAALPGGVPLFSLAAEANLTYSRQQDSPPRMKDRWRTDELPR